MTEILYRQYRDYIADRVDVNNAMMALLAGSRLAAHTLQLTTGSTATLAQLFPAVEHIDRFNLRSDSARQLLQEADEHVASVAMPYALATHEEFVMAALDLLASSGRSLVRGKRPVKAWNMHEVLFDTCGYTPPPEWLETFHALREARNCIIHSGGASSTRLDDAIKAMGPASRHGWARLNRGDAPEALVQAARLALTAEHVFTTFAVTKRLGREVNAALAKDLDSATWARMAVEDFATETDKPRNSNVWRRSVLGFVRFHYSQAKLSEADIEKAARDTGRWTATKWA